MQASVRASLEQFSLPHPSGEGRLTISVAAPAAAAPGAPTPTLPTPTLPTATLPTATLYVVDGDLVFGVAAELARVLMAVEAFPPLHVVGIGYDAGYQDFLKRRTADLTPPLGAEGVAALGALAATIGVEHNGGADAFLAFLVEVLRPELAARHPQTAGGEQVLFGHSLGGLFAAHALLTAPDAFDGFIVSSPSLWWDGFSILQKLPAFAARLQALARRPAVFVDVGGHEQDLPTSVPPGFPVTLEEAQAQIRNARMVDAARDFAEAVARAGIERLRHVAFAEEDHTSVAPPAVLHGLRFALGQNRGDTPDSGRP